MILAQHTAHLTTIVAQPVPADPSIGISGSAPLVRWAGDAQIHVREHTVDEVVGSQRVRVTEAIVDIPANIPVYPGNEDELTFTNLHDGSVQTVKVRDLDTKFQFLGFVRATCRVS